MAKPLRYFLLGAALLCCTPLFAQQNWNARLTVDESKISFHLQPGTRLDFPLFNNSDHSLSGTLRLDLLDTDSLGEVVAQQTRAFDITPGAHISSAKWDFNPPIPSIQTLESYRLRYTVTPKQPGDFQPVQGFVQLGLHIADGFAIQGFPGGQFHCDSDCRFWIRVADPRTGQPWPDTKVMATVYIANQAAATVRQVAMTNRDGFAAFHLELPPSRSKSYGQLELDAYRGAFKAGVGGSIWWARLTRLYLTTDKPIYQPGQTVHMRTLVIGFDGRAWKNASVVVKITNPQGQEQFRETVLTSKFGVASVDWHVPEKVRLGDFRISASVESPSKLPNPVYLTSAQTSSTIHISRYELPAFTVKIAADRPYYLPGQDATLEISGEYLFGKRVKHGKVKVAERWRRSGALAEGELDASGKFVAHINLRQKFAYLQSRQKQLLGSVRFQDWPVDVFLTDASTGQTEQRRFTLRVSLQPIHLYIAKPQMPFGSGRIVYITSSYADGRSASVKGSIEAVIPNKMGKFSKFPDSKHRILLGTFHTNSYGVARFDLPREWLEYAYPRGTKGDYSWYSKHRLLTASRSQATKRAYLLINATDSQGQKGTGRELISVLPMSSYGIEIKTDHTLYHPGDPIHLLIQADKTLTEALVEIETGHSRLVGARVVHLRNGEGELAFPYRADFRGLLKIWTYAVKATDDPAPVAIVSSEVIYPAGDPLKVNVRFARTTLRPGQTATTDIHVTNVEGKPVQSDLGVAVIDRAVEERMRTERDFGGAIGFSRREFVTLSRNLQYANIAGITKTELLSLDPSKPFPDGLDLVAQALLYPPQHWAGWVWGNLHPNTQFLDEKYLEPLVTALDKNFQSSGRYPVNAQELRAELKEFGINLDSIRDAWGDPYRPLFATHGKNAVLIMVSNGADKLPDTKDDYAAYEFKWPYFQKWGEKLDKVARKYYAQTGECFDDYSTLHKVMEERDNINLDSLLDPWGSRYRYSFRLEGNQCVINVKSAGPNREFWPDEAYYTDDVPEWKSSVKYFVRRRAALERSLDEHYVRTGEFPQTEKDLKPVLIAAKLTGNRLLDPWGKPYRFNFFSSKRYSDRVEMETYADYLGHRTKKTRITPVTEQVANIQIISDSSSGGNVVAEFTRTISEQSSKEVLPVLTPREQPRSGKTGGVSGIVTGVDGEAIQNALVEAVSRRRAILKTARTNSHGCYNLSALPVGIYKLKFTAGGFRTWVVTQVPVQQGNTTKVDAELEGNIHAQRVLQSERIRVGGAIGGVVGRVNQTIAVRTMLNGRPLFTPRLRQYFPETLLWRPEVITDARGNARIKFRMADSITTWKMSVMASSLGGQMGLAHQDLRTFQPFQIEDQIPEVLTQGDRLSVPLVIRNYSKRTQTVIAELKPAPWFSALSPSRRKVSIPAQSGGSTVFTIVATAATREGTHQIIARNGHTGDAVQHEVTVHPDGDEISTSVAKILVGSDDKLDISVPENAIAGSIDAELQIYPNLTAHVLNALRNNPPLYFSCPQAIASNGYANLLVLELLGKVGQDNSDPSNPHSRLAAESRSSVAGAQNQLLGMQLPDGSFNCCFACRKHLPILPTGYVLRFLNQSGKLVPIDRSGIERAERYLMRLQRRSGAWMDYDHGQGEEVDDRDLTAFVARTLAEASAFAKGSERQALQRAVTRAMKYLEDQIGSWQDAYLVGNYAIAAAISGRSEYIGRAQELLRSLAHNEGATTYWNLEANTSPFGTWGLSGRLETTALAVEALCMFQSRSPNPDTAAEMNRGLQFMLSHKDTRGSWYGRLITQEVMEAIVTALPWLPETPTSSGGTTPTSIIVNRHHLPDIQLPPVNAVVEPVTLEIGAYLHRGINRVEIRRSGKSPAVNAAAYTSYYIPWKESTATTQENLHLGESRSLRLNVHFDRNNPAVGQAVDCQVDAERIGFRGYGMLVAKVGLPPGADVDRASLKLSRSVLGYEVQPDRVVFYLRPVAGGVKFDFQFRLRYRMKAAAAPSVLYDYYNSDSRAVVQPERFTVQ